MTTNVFRQFQQLLPRRPLEIATATHGDGGSTVVELPGGGRLRVRGTAAPGQKVFVRDGAIEGEAPNLPLSTLEI